MNTFLFFIHFLIFYTSLSASQIPLDSTLYASKLKQTWASPNSTFYVGFIQLGPSTFVAAVNYISGGSGAGIPIWVAGGFDTTVDSGASFHFRSSGLLQLVNGSGVSVWDSGTSHRGVTSSSIDDNGNLVLFNGSKFVWSTFENPTDTIVAGQNFTVNQTLRSGSYSFRFLDSGNLTLRWNDSIVYWNLPGLNSAANNATLTSPILSLQQIGMLQISDSALPSPSIVAYSSDYGEGSDILRFLRLDSDGNLRMYSSVRGSTDNITIRWAGVRDQCQVFGYCGKMGICSYTSSSSTPVCQCPSLNFELVDASDSRKGCKRKVELKDCPRNETMLQLNNTRFLTYPPELDRQVFFVGITACRLNCVAGGSCVAATSLSDGDGLCYLKTNEFISGYQNPTLPSTSYLKVCMPILFSGSSDLPNTPINNKKKKKYVAIIVPILVLFSTGIVMGLLYYLRKKGEASSNHTLVGALKNLPGMPKEFEYGDLKKATNNFDEKNKLGKGGFGVVYKGLLAKENLYLAVKLFSREHTKSQSDFLSELTIINRLRHKHLVPLLGWCHMKGSLLLVYEYMPNGSLDKHIFHENGDESSILEWRLRYNVLVGVASALNYLHNEFDQKVVHRDLKASNIMLDSHYNARLGDFGLARALDNEKTSYAELEGVPGTKGYIAPECFLTGKTSRDSDIYGFGAVILEVVCGKRPWTKLESFNFLVDWVWWLHREGRILDAVDERVGHDYVAEEAQRLLLLGLACSNPKVSERPKADSICRIMAGSMDVPYVPPFKPAFLWPTDSEFDSSNQHSRFNVESSIAHPSSIASCTLPR